VAFAPSPPPLPAPGKGGSLARILIVEDTPQMAETLVLGLQHDETPIDTAHDGSEALAWVRQQRYDLILLDLGLPDMDGMEVLRRLKQDCTSAHIPVIVMTGREGTSDKLQAFELGATDYVTKPFALVELRARAESVLRTKRLQDELSQANQQLAAKAEFLAKTSHEIRTQLGAVTSMAGLMAETNLDADQRDCLQTIRSSGQSLLVLLNDILNASKLEAGKVELEQRPFHLRLTLDEALATLAAKAAEKNLELLCQLEPGTPEEVVGDANRLKQVLVNLLSNAVKFTESGEVELRASVRPLTDDTLSADPAGSTTHREFHFTVRDSGVGIPAERLGRLFRSYGQADSTIHSQFGGTGLGLYISKGLVELMGGRIWVESVANCGSTFHFTVSLQTAANPEAAPWRDLQPQLQGCRALILDDNASCRRLLAQDLERWGVPSTPAGSVSEALECLRKDSRLSLALIDSALPATDNAALARLIRGLTEPRLFPLIWLTPLGRLCAAAGATESPGGSSVNKPVKPAVLHSALVRAAALGTAPTKDPPAQPGCAVPVSPAPNAGSSQALRILLTDDNVINRKVGLRMLKHLGYPPDTASSGAEALAAWERERYDLILMDVRMPGLDGLETTRRIRAQERQSGQAPSVIVALTASAMTGDREQCLAAGMDDYLIKPVAPEELRRVIHERFFAKPAPSPSSPAVSPPPAPGLAESFDRARLLDFTGGSRESLVEIAEMYLQQTSEQMAGIANCLNNGDCAQITGLAHTCAGASGTCGLSSMAAAARALEKASLEGCASALAPLHERLQAEFERARTFLNQELQSTPPTLNVASAANEPKPGPNPP
jgi:CheY-like chemotaxis protein